MTFRIRLATSGREVRSSVSEQPVQSWKCSQMTEGFFAWPMAFAIAVAEAFCVSVRPTGAATISMPQKERKSRRETPAFFRLFPIVCFSGKSGLDMNEFLSVNKRLGTRRYETWGRPTPVNDRSNLAGGDVYLIGINDWP